MPRYIVKVGDLYGEWSTIVDAPVTWLMPYEEFEAYYRERYGTESMRYEFGERMARVQEKGTSSHLDDDAEDTMSINRCGPNEESAPVEYVIEQWKLGPAGAFGSKEDA